MDVDFVKTGDPQTDKDLKTYCDSIRAELKKEPDCLCHSNDIPKIIVSMKNGERDVEIKSCQECYAILKKFLEKNRFK